MIMMMKTTPKALVAAAILAGIPLLADPLLSPDDPIIAFDLDAAGVLLSDYPASDGPASAIDGRISTKYANTARTYAGFIVTLPSAQAVQSFVITTGSIAVQGDPAEWVIYGTNEPITSADNSTGDSENWEEIFQGTLELPAARQTPGPVTGFPNSTAYTSYRLVFPTLKAATAPAMHIGEIQFYPEEDGSGDPLLSPGLPIIAIHSPLHDSRSPANETADLAFDDNTATKYLNFGKLHTGFIVTPEIGPSVVRSIRVTSANDAVDRDPSSFQIFGTDDPITSFDHDTGEEENWTLVAEGALALPATRFAEAPIVSFPNSTAWTSWRIVFPTVKNPAAANSMQISEVQLFTEEDGGGDPVLTPGDPVVPIQRLVSDSAYRSDKEGPPEAVDGLASTKYLNLGGRRSGFIVTPAAGARAVQSFVLTTANDQVASDPASFLIYGTNSPIASLDNSTGLLENWTLVASGDLDLPDERGVAAPAVSFTNAASFTSWKLIFPSLKDRLVANGMHIAEVQFFTGANGAGTPVLAPGDPIIAVQLPLGISSSPGHESPAQGIDGSTSTKYLNFAELNTGFIVTPNAGPQIVRSLKLTTANDAIERDPMTWVLFGTNDVILSPPDSEGDLENWTFIARGDTELTEERFMEGPVLAFPNSTAYASYRLVFPTVRNPAAANSMQFSEVQFYPDEDGFDEPILSPDDPIVGIHMLASQSASPVAEEAIYAIDGDPGQKYLNFGRENAGFIVTPGVGPSVVTGFTMTTANDFPARDPVLWDLYGTNDAVRSWAHSFGDQESWSLIASGALELPEERFTEGEPVTFANTTPWTSYRFVVRTVRNAPGADSFQFGEIQFEGTAAALPPADFAITNITTSGNPVTSVTLSWGSVADTSYTVQANPGLGPAGSWIDVDTVVATGPSASSTVNLTLHPSLTGQPQVFLRVRRN